MAKHMYGESRSRQSLRMDGHLSCWSVCFAPVLTPLLTPVLLRVCSVVCTAVRASVQLWSDVFCSASKI